MPRRNHDGEFVEKDVITGRPTYNRLNKKKLSSEDLDEIFIES